MISVVFVLFLIEGFVCYIFGMPKASTDICETVSLVLIMINMNVLLIYIAKRYKYYNRIVVYALMTSVLLKCFLVIWDYYGADVFVLPNSHADSESFHIQGVYFAQGIYTKVENYSYIIGIIYSMFGIQRITAQFFNVLLSFAGIGLLDNVLIGIKINNKVKDKTLIFASLLPNYLIMSSILIRECIISVILCLSLYFYMKWWSNNNWVCFCFSIIISFGACYFHSGAIAVTIGYTISIILTRKEIGNKRVINISWKSIIMSLFLITSFLYLFKVFSGSLLSKFQGLSMQTIENHIEEHNIYSDKSSGNTSTYTAGNAGYSGLTGLIINSPIRMFYFLWVPMPWSIRGFGDVLAFVGSSCFYGGVTLSAMTNLIKNRANKKNNVLLIVLLIIALCGALVFAWGVDSAGSALRHREKFYFVYLLLFAVLQDIIFGNNKIRENSHYRKSY